ncbi:hypothetical protein MGYG_08560 [Nannizzia gypsea CBS 118893]|uniref:Uncharacterized protein n=1 Tax=Arthroderma gypseum (strain ATCC MYA-4604 / CBS 118893) TaxID=535722 RepID=E4V619_ARTGP|nr:hypothetical protein MGYG_08560 [Nannizzia gypsea CBS 118893]EFR05544.1 hypothetical protein MGYG_08560 [Nannizzia gypsea CBS 118893]
MEPAEKWQSDNKAKTNARPMHDEQTMDKKDDAYIRWRTMARDTQDRCRPDPGIAVGWWLQPPQGNTQAAMGIYMQKAS